MIVPFLHYWQEHRRTTKLRDGDQKVQDAMRVLSRRIADAEFHRTMAGFYTDRVIATDPHTDWWGFADAKQKQYDHQLDCLAEEKRTEEARAVVEARKAELAKLRAPLVAAEQAPLELRSDFKTWAESKLSNPEIMDSLKPNYSALAEENRLIRNAEAVGFKRTDFKQFVAPSATPPPEPMQYPLPKHCGPVGAERCLYCGKRETDSNVARCIDAKAAYKKAQEQTQ